MLQESTRAFKSLDGNIPVELASRPQWVVWKHETRPGEDKPTKRPYNPKTQTPASHSNSDTWVTFREAHAVLAADGTPWDGAGFVFAADDPFVGVDLDKVRDPETGVLIPEAQEIVDAFEGSYIEPSPSETGVHIIAKGQIPFENGKTGTNRKFAGGKTRIEAYNALRFFTVTGKGNPVDTIAHKQSELDRLYKNYLKASEKPLSAPVSVSNNGVGPTDAQILQRLSAEKEGKAARLLKGDIEGYESRSEADLALCSKIAWYTEDTEQIERIWKSSGLMRAKIDNRPEYVADTVEKAMKPSGEHFDWSALKARAVNYEPSTNGTKESAAPRLYTKTDTGNAERLVDTFGSEIRWVEQWKRWVVWDGKRWVQDSGLSLVKMAGKVARNIHKEAAEAIDTAEQKAISKWAFQSQNEGRINAMISLARTHVRAKAEVFDLDPWLLNVQNGTLDLRTRELREHNPADFLTKISPSKYDPHAEAPRFEQFLSEVFCDDEELSTFMQRFAGYTLTGSTRERCFAILHGSGRNGKSTLVELIQHVLGDYSKNTDTETVLAKKYSGVGNDVAALVGARFVSAAEIEAGRQLAEAKVKNLTGSDTVTARFLYGEPFDFKPQFKLWLSTNNKPEVKGTDNAIWDRIKLIPFRVRFEGDNHDANLPETLRKEQEGVLAWMVRGCIDWQQNGLGSAGAVDLATEGYREEMDELGAFLDEKCVVAEDKTVEFKELYCAYVQWASTEGADELNRKSFGKALAERGILPDKGSGNKAIRIGITLRAYAPSVASRGLEDYTPRPDF
jgi:putative DNA primase/helicase